MLLISPATNSRKSFEMEKQFAITKQVSEDEEVNKTKYLSLITYLMLARFTRIDILMSVNFLATKSANPIQNIVTTT